MIMTEYDLLLCRLCDQAFIEIDECPNCGNELKRIGWIEQSEIMQEM